MATSNKSKITQQACGDPPLQDGANKDSEGPHATGTLATQARLERCLPNCPNVSGTPEIPEVPMARPVLAVSSPSLWTEQCTTDVHQTHEANDSIAKEDGNQTGHVSRRHAHHS